MSLLQFRAWNKKTQSFIDYGDLVLDLRSGKIYAGDIGLVESTIDVTDQIELMQSTGMKDKNGVEIFEGDVVITSKGAIGYVAYLQQEAGFVVALKKSDYRLGHRNTGESYDVATAHEVIGNIYENSELLEVE
ncbi:YopX family protein [Enterococcus faecium]|nr:YopX family protein [Enterococcus faecium]MCH3311077.1 YopX family protein [Enterococcus faecium]MCH3313698.1 YopX family protein [Enterococcus faecium]MCH3389688.1 YopX family protein [Enterococcus faecium]MCH3443617.1 YopX family protein [Enterococcus faecium]